MTIDFSQLADEIASRVIEALPQNTVFGLVDTATAAKLMKGDEKHKKAVLKMAKDGELPFIVKDRQYYFDITDIRAWIARNKQVGAA